jgi:hypothetical protein
LPDEPAARRRRAQLTPQECVTLYRTKYTAPLVCIECGRLIASLAGYVEERIRLAYVCAECRMDAAEAEKRREVSLANLALAQAARAAQKVETGTTPDLAAPVHEPSRKPAESLMKKKGFSGTSRLGGRPPLPPRPPHERRQLERDRKRAYRAQRKQLIPVA